MAGLPAPFKSWEGMVLSVRWMFLGQNCYPDCKLKQSRLELSVQILPAGQRKAVVARRGSWRQLLLFFFFFLPTSFFPAIVSPYIKFYSFCFCFCFMVWDLSNDFRTCVPHALWLLWFSIRSHNLSWTICFSREKRQSKWKVKMFIAQYYFKSRCHFLLTSQVRERNKTKSKTSK